MFIFIPKFESLSFCLLQESLHDSRYVTCDIETLYGQSRMYACWSGLTTRVQRESKDEMGLTPRGEWGRIAARDPESTFHQCADSKRVSMFACGISRAPMKISNSYSRAPISRTAWDRGGSEIRIVRILEQFGCEAYFTQFITTRITPKITC